jgi:2-keto-4-pentenoate hydratase/2-oxohepta-3-ene-1,7-dioic acid hydratase in catechol pathway
MKLVMFRDDTGADLRPGILTDRGVIDIAAVVPPMSNGRPAMAALIDRFDALRPDLDELAHNGEAVALESLSLGPPIPRPGKIVNCIGNYWEHAQREPRELNMFLKNPDAVIGPGDVIRLPSLTEPWAFMHEAELAIVFKGPAKDIAEADWRDAAFGYTGAIDVTARERGRTTRKKGSWIGKSFDTFAPVGPCIVTADEIDDPNDLHIQLWNNGGLRHNYNTDDMEHRVPEIISFVTHIMTMNSGDIVFCGTNHEGLGFLQDGETVELEIHGIGRMSLKVSDPLKRGWERGVYLGEDSTHHSAVRRYRLNVTLNASDASVPVAD